MAVRLDMNKGILILQNVTRERPGFILDVLEEYQIPYTKIDLSKSESIPGFDVYDAMVVLGGYDSANDQTYKILNQIERVREWIGSGKPYLGICLGLQILVKSVGGNVIPLHTKEIGFRAHDGGLYTLHITPEGRADALFEGLHDTLQFFQLHEDTIELTDRMKLLATGSHSTNQVIRVGEYAYGLQCHFEINEDIFKAWMREHPYLTKMDQETLYNDFTQFSDMHIETGKKIFTNFLKIAKLPIYEFIRV